MFALFEMSLLESVPDNVLQLIAFFHFISTEGPPPVFQLLSTNRAIYEILSTDACPELYARVYLFKFDLGSPQRLRSSWLTDECLATELVHRFQVLRRFSLRQLSEECIRSDLWTAYMMILESDGLNERQLASAEVGPCLLEFIFCRFREECHKYGRPLASEINSLALWVIYLTSSAREFLMETGRQR